MCLQGAPEGVHVLNPSKGGLLNSSFPLLPQRTEKGIRAGVINPSVQFCEPLGGGHPAGVPEKTRVYRPVSRGFPVVCYRKTDRERHFCWDAGQVSQEHQHEEMGIQEIHSGRKFLPTDSLFLRINLAKTYRYRYQSVINWN